ncbi:putative Glycosyl transferase, family 2 [uncultured Desulfobacterium sp.]|uniref:Putative Glycosyl transferase, family 2 n=1 Tax=uncultured Desulfobacterium sp. TaxID=201089 RepID=A0A445MZY4_9BACT|nr:putative Glycosyl transferase, family 2 [uncultured Desulfobacterium sp.]
MDSSQKIALSISVIIPCKNEEAYIGSCIGALLKQKEIYPELEIIVVDNGSTDRTAEIVGSFKSGIKVFHLANVTISELRNYGVNKSKRELLAFIDADVEVGLDWYANVLNSLTRLEKRGLDLRNIVTGSTYAIPDESTWVERVWYNQLTIRDRKKNNYINGGNLIIHRELFNEIGGFNPGYATGEDVKICQDAISKGGKIIKDISINSVHHGYPKTLRMFFRRELWHGIGMRQNLLTPWRSRDLLYAIYNIAVVVLSSVVYCSYRHGHFLVLAFGLLSVPPLIFSMTRISGRANHLIPLALLFFIYGLARSSCLVDIVIKATRRNQKT